MEKPPSFSPPRSWLNADQAGSSIDQEVVNYYIITQTTFSAIKL